MLRDILFYPEKLRTDYTFDFGPDCRELFIPTEDGEKLNALHFSLDNPRGCVVYAHGNAGNLASWGAVAAVFNELGYEVIIYDYRGYGKSSGEVGTEAQFYRDAECVLRRARMGFAEQDIILYGRSLGTAMMTHLARGSACRQLILETPFVSVPDLARTLFPMLPAGLPLDYKFDIGAMLREVNIRVDLIHGTQDEIVPYDCSVRLAQMLGDDSILHTVRGGHHNDLSMYPDYHNALTAILKQGAGKKGT